jgi:hypothetical protein
VILQDRDGTVKVDSNGFQLYKSIITEERKQLEFKAEESSFKNNYFE